MADELRILLPAGQVQQAPPVPPTVHAALLTPTSLAADGDLVAASDSIVVTIEDVAVIEARPASADAEPLAFAPLGPFPRLRFADIDRTSPDDAWTLLLLAIDNPATADAGIVNTGVGDENPLLATAANRRAVWNCADERVIR